MEGGKKQLGIDEIKPNPYRGYDLILRVAQPGGDRPKDFLSKSSDGSLDHRFARYPKAR